MIPVKDDAPQLAACLAALAAQTATIDEIVVVDNGSSDDSAAVAIAGGARVVACATPGIPAAAARGYDAARGDVILRLDADCRPGQAWVATMTGALAEDARVAAVSGGAAFVDGPAMLRRPLAALYMGAYLAFAITALGHPPVFGSNLAMRGDAWRDVRREVHRHDAELHDDLDLAFHLGELGRIRWVSGAQMGMSMRPFASARRFARRVVRGLRTVAVHWPDDFPPMRWARRVAIALDEASLAATSARGSEGRA